ncbi:MAG: D-glycerate dehydrogenase [Thermomicrobiales bacterium]|jgi:glyoxylate reductase|nr:D-glycerate dehydrogenase [Thermomicrobiales bacterium]
MAKVALTRILPDAGMALLKEAESAGEIELDIWPDDLPPDREALAALLHGCDGAIVLVTDPIGAELLDAEPQLRVLSQFAVGYDNIDLAAATARGVAVCNTPGVLTETTADLAWALLMASARRVVEGADYVRAGKWQTWGPTLLMGADVHHATLGIVGFGRIGKEVAKRGRGFDMRILAFDTMPDEKAAADLGIELVDLETLLRESDFVSLHCALTEETRHLIDAEALALMKPTAVLINAARGPVVDTDALVDALKTGAIAGAGLDVTDPEPIPADHPLVGLQNVVIVPHIASASIATRGKMAEMAAQNLLAVLRGERPAHIVNPDVLS